MKMVVAVVRDEYAAALTEQLTHKGFGATKLASTGGFLKAGNTTFLIGVAAAQLEEVLGVIRHACPSKKGIQGDLTLREGSLKHAAANPAHALPYEVNVGGATVFVLDVERMIKV
ncbi:MAG TPA: cyclic-di-AMP receptor [Symbiobacteriaceae bacterium]|nr:cyclic-di-AMP receptor [Symbiobacteriaceae bacterium]